MSEISTSIVLNEELGDKTAEAVKTLVETKQGKFEFSITLGDLAEADVDAIACPANPAFEPAYMLGGVQGALARKSGMATFEEAERKAKAYLKNPEVITQHGDLVGLPLGFAATTTAGNLKRKKAIIHVNNMRMGGICLHAMKQW